MDKQTLRSFMGLLVLAGVVALRLTPRSGGDAAPAVMKSYTHFSQQSVHRRGCLDPASRELNEDVDVVRLSVDEETTLLVTMHGYDGLEPGFVVTADQGAAAQQSWMREVGSRTGDAFSATVVLPAAGSYAFVIADRRELTGDEMAAGRGCFTVDFKPTAPPPLQVLPLAWRGTVGTPIAFSVPRRGRDLTLVEVNHAGGDGVLLVSVFEDKEYVRSLTIAEKHNARVMVSSRFVNARILVEEAANWGREPLRAMVRAVPYSIAPDAQPIGGPDRLASAAEEAGL